MAHSFEKLISLDNLLLAWQEFLRGKRGKPDVQEFGLHLIDNLLDLHQELKDRTYKHGTYEHFKINDPKPRDIHKASVRDRLVHHAIYRQLYPYFDRTFIADSFSCRLRKGTHKAINRFRTFSRKAAKNNTRPCYVLKCDIRKFFANIDHIILKAILAKHIADPNTLALLENVIDSFSTTSQLSTQGAKLRGGLPLGNLTSQLLVNIYMNEFDQYIKHTLKARHYIRYADDFVFLSPDRNDLAQLLPQIEEFLWSQLHLALHPDKVFLKTFSSGVDFLGWVHFSDHRILRTSTKRRMFRNLEAGPPSEGRVRSYLGLLAYGNTHKLRQYINRGGTAT